MIHPPQLTFAYQKDDVTSLWHSECYCFSSQIYENLTLSLSEKLPEQC